jgi:hypothetical protein
MLLHFCVMLVAVAVDIRQFAGCPVAVKLTHTLSRSLRIAAGAISVRVTTDCSVMCTLHINCRQLLICH